MQESINDFLIWNGFAKIKASTHFWIHSYIFYVSCHGYTVYNKTFEGENVIFTNVLHRIFFGTKAFIIKRSCYHQSFPVNFCCHYNRKSFPPEMFHRIE